MRHPCSNLFNPYWELIYCDTKWYQGTSKPSASPEIAIGTQFHVQHDSKATSVF